MYADALGRRRVTDSSYLDVTEHWETILDSLFNNNTAGAHRRRLTISDYCVIALYSNRVGHGVVAGNVNARYQLVVLNHGDINFDPCLPI